MENVREQEKRKMVVRFHALLREAGVDEEGKRDLLSGYGVESSRALTEEQLSGLIRWVEENLLGKCDRLRKRVLRAVCQFCEAVETAGWSERTDEERIAYAKRIVCRASGVDNFNRIGADRLRSVAYAFEKQKRDMERVVEEAGRIVRGD